MSADNSTPTGRCAPGPQEHALCGWAFDAYESGDATAPVVFAAPGQTVTCQRCREFLDHIRRTFSGYRVR